jgi:PAS domain S-box-containing protein
MQACGRWYGAARPDAATTTIPSSVRRRIGTSAAERVRYDPATWIGRYLERAEDTSCRSSTAPATWQTPGSGRPRSWPCITRTSSSNNSSRPAASGQQHAGILQPWRDASWPALSMPETEGARRELRQALDESVQLLGGDGGLVYLRSDEPGVLVQALTSGLPGSDAVDGTRQIRLQIDHGMFGRAVSADTIVRTGDYAADTSFLHDPRADEFMRLVDARSMIVAPLPGPAYDPAASIGAMGVFAGRSDAFSASQEGLARTLAEHAASAIHTADLVRQLADSRRELARRVEVEQALREIAGRLTVLHDPAEVLQRAVDAAASLLDADGARIDLQDERDGALYWAYDAVTGKYPGLGPIEGDGEADPGEGISGRAVITRGPVWTGDYLNDTRFVHAPQPDAFADMHAIRSALAVPIIAEAGVLGTLTVYTDQVDAYGPDEAELLVILAHQASLAITNARLIEQLDRSRTDLARQADVERALREITTELNAVRDPEEILHRIAHEGARLLDTERVYINVLDEHDGAKGWAWYSPTEKGHDPWPAEDAIRVDEGMTGKAIAERRPIITGDYLNDTRFVHRPGPDSYTAELGLPSAIVVPIFDGDEPLGALLAESTIPDAFTEADASRLEVLARQAGIALSNARLLQRLRRSEQQLRDSEARYRYLVTASPDVVWEVDLEGRFTFVSDAIERMTGWSWSDVVGRRMVDAITAETLPAAERQLMEVRADPDRVTVARFGLRHRDGSTVPIENFAMGLVRDGVLIGGHGAGRDLSDRDRMETDLRRQAAELAASAERAHLARELHDSVTQALFAMSLTTRSIELLLPRDREAALEKFEELRQLQREALAEMRSLIFELRPGSLERDGLAQALRTHTAALESRVGLSILVTTVLPERLPLELEDNLFRIAQEALHNVVKHAAAKHVRVTVEARGDFVRLSVTDDGRGFDPAAVPEAHLGLTGMRARAERLGGTVTIRSRPGEGTTVEIRMPIVPASRSGEVIPPSVGPPDGGAVAASADA